MKEAARPARLLLAAKTALAVGIAWAIAPHMPGVTDEYPYYAPLGALVSMYPTLMGSAKSSLQTLFGLATGVALATLVVVTVGPNWWAVPLVVGIGVLLSGTGWYGAGREYAPVAALFVLIVGGHDADAYSLGYLVQMTVGIVVGLVVNLAIAPSTSSAAAGARIDAFRRQLGQHLHDIGDSMVESWPPEHERWSRNAGGLGDTAAEVRRALNEADESRKGNPRALFHRRDVEEDRRRLEALDMMVHHIRDVSGALSDTIWRRRGALTFDEELVEPLGAACHAVATAIEQDASESERRHRASAEAAREVRLLVERVDERTLAVGRAMGPGVLTAMHLRRVLILLHDDRLSDAPE